MRARVRARRGRNAENTPATHQNSQEGGKRAWQAPKVVLCDFSGAVGAIYASGQKSSSIA